MRGLDSEAESARGSFVRVAESHVRRVHLKAGDLLAFANDRLMHGRDAFVARYDGTDRWLLRAYVLRDPTRLSDFASPSRPDVVA